MITDTKNLYKIVIAENQPIVIQGLISSLKENSEFEILGVVKQGEELKTILDKSEANTVIMDLRLPGTNIYRLVKDLVVSQSQVKLIAFTNYTMPKLMQDLMEFGMHAYLSKTASIAEIKEAIVRVNKGEQFICSSVYERNKNKGNSNEFMDELDRDFIRFSELTVREMDIVILVSSGFTNRDMAEKLNLSKFTIETHRRNLMNKLDLKTSGQLVFFASRQGLV